MSSLSSYCIVEMDRGKRKVLSLKLSGFNIWTRPRSELILGLLLYCYLDEMYKKNASSSTNARLAQR